MTIDTRSVTHPSVGSDPPSGIDPVAPLRAVLAQVEAVLAGLTQAQYVQNPVGTFKSSIGGHVRHCLDHIEALISADAGFIDYDKRRRGTSIETDLAAAIAETRRLSAALDSLSGRAMGGDLVVSLMLSGDGPALRWGSSLGRELAFVLSHTIHHGAMIAAMVELVGAEVPAGFGLAPSTIAYRAGH